MYLCIQCWGVEALLRIMPCTLGAKEREVAPAGQLSGQKTCNISRIIRGRIIGRPLESQKRTGGVVVNLAFGDRTSDQPSRCVSCQRCASPWVDICVNIERLKAIEIFEARQSVANVEQRASRRGRGRSQRVAATSSQERYRGPYWTVS